jgi:CHAT domain-containing protein/tetratricopeptide (TPR) repeat protein
MSGLALTLLCLAQQPLDAESAARTFLAAWRARDAEAQTSAAQAADPFLVADALFGLHLAAADGNLLDAATALAERVADRKDAAALPALVASWRALSGEDLDRERRLRTALARLPTSSEASASDDARRDLALTSTSVTAVRLHLERGAACERKRKIDEAARAFEAAARAARALGWTRGRIQALHGMGQGHFHAGRMIAAVAAWQEELTLLEELGEESRAAHVRLMLADASARLREWPGALEHLDRALAVFERLEDPLAVARTLNLLGNVLADQGAPGAARERLEDAIRRFEALDDRPRAAAARCDLAMVERRMGRPEVAAPLLRRALTELQTQGNRRAIAGALGNLGLVLEDLGRFAEAAAHHERARAAYEELGDRSGVAISLVARAVALRNLGRPVEALELLEQALRLQESLGDRAGALVTRVELADLHVALGHDAGAMDLLERALEEQLARGDRYAVRMTLSVLADVEQSLGESSRALRRLESLLRDATEEDPVARARLLHRIGVLRLEGGDAEEGARCLERALKTLRAAGARAFAALAERDLGFAWLAMGRTKEAGAALQASLRESEALGDRVGSAITLRGLARLDRLAGRGREALIGARRALTLLRTVGRGLGGSGAPRTLDQARRASDVGLLAGAELLESEPDDADRVLRDVFWLAEAGRGLLLVEGLVNRDALLGARVPEELLTSHVAARARVESHWNRVVLLSSGEGVADPRALAAARADLDAAYVGLEEVIRRVQREERRVADVLYPEPVALESLRRVLAPGDLFLLYQLTDERALALALDRESARLVDLGDAAEVRRRAEAWMRVVAAVGTEEASLARELYDALLGPLEPMLPGVSRLIVSPDGPLNFLPWEALLAGDPGSRVLDRFEVAYVPSASVLASLVDDGAAVRRGRGLLALADPLEPGDREAVAAGTRRGRAGLERLPGAREEADALARLFEGEPRTLLVREEASVEGLDRSLRALETPLRALHFACHGFLAADRPALTGLVLSDGRMLTIEDLHRLRIPADLAVLSACQTGHGKVLRGEGVLGLVRGFFFAGVPRVVVSNWKVDDASTRTLMVSFYERMLAGGRAPGPALREARRALRRAPGLEHPYHWAAFVLWGLPD